MSWIQHHVRDLGRNLRAGFRLLTLRRVSLLDFRCNLPQLALLLALGLALRLFDEARGAEFVIEWSADGWLQEGFYTALVLGVASLLAQVLRQPHLALALPCVLLAGAPFFEVIGWGERALQGLAADRWPPGAMLVSGLATLWLLVWLWRSVAVSLHPRRPRFWLRANAGAGLLAGALLIPSSLIAPAQLVVPASHREPPGASKLDLFSEEALTAQMQLLSESLDGIEDEHPNQTDVFFVGFAPFAGAEVFRRDLELARDAVEDRYGAGQRSVTLLNNPATVTEEPWATVSNLRLSLNTVGEIMNREEDVLFLYLTSHGSENQELEADLPPLKLKPLTPSSLAGALDEAGIKWRVIVISACYSGGFIAPLQDPNTLIITSARADRSSFGCDDSAEFTYFGQAFFGQALREERSLVGAFERARRLVSERERSENLTPSEPQMHLGEAMRDKLAQFEREEPMRRFGMMAQRSPKWLPARFTAPRTGHPGTRGRAAHLAGFTSARAI